MNLEMFDNFWCFDCKAWAKFSHEVEQSESLEFKGTKIIQPGSVVQLTCGHHRNLQKGIMQILKWRNDQCLYQKES